MLQRIEVQVEAPYQVLIGELPSAEASPHL